jgi:integrase
VIKALTDPPTAEEKISGAPPDDANDSKLLPPDTEENLRRQFEVKGWTDYNWIRLPTEKLVTDMLTGTSHKPSEVIKTIDITGGQRQLTVEKEQTFIENTAPATTLREQAERWIASLPNRRRRPVKPATIHGWRHALDKWVLPHLGDQLLSEVSNGALRSLVEKMSSAGLAPQSIIAYSNVVKMVVASAVNENGDQLHPRQWNHDFVGIRVLDQTKQRRPTVAATQIERLLGSVKEMYAVLFALLAGSGLRIGEALGLKVTDLTDDCTVIQVQRSVWFGQEQTPKTPNAIRSVDIAEPLAKLLRAYIAGKSGYLFGTRQGKPLLQRNVLRILYRGLPEKVCGLHTFRRFRTAQLRKERVPEDLIKFWLGHARNLTDNYASQLREDVTFRQQWAERAGLGFSIVSMGSNTVVSIEVARVA